MASKTSEFFMGARDMMPHHLGVFPFGLVFGVIAMASGLSTLEAILMSSIIFGGASQIVFVQLWSAGVPSFIVGSSVAIVNLRHLLYSASLTKYVESLPLKWRMILAYLLTDQSYALMVQKYRINKFSDFNHYYFLGSGLTLWLGWQLATIIGVLGASFISEQWSLTFAISLTFIAIVIPLLKTRADLIACFVAGILSILLQPLPWKLWLILAGLGGIAAGWIATTVIKKNRKPKKMIWIIMIVAGLITYSTRFSMFNKSIAEKMPSWVEIPLHYVPIALLTAIIVPEVLIHEQNLSLSIFENLRIIAASFAILIAFISRNVIATIASGLVCLWVLQWLL